jgi:dCMP deaminase
MSLLPTSFPARSMMEEAIACAIRCSPTERKTGALFWKDGSVLSVAANGAPFALHENHRWMLEPANREAWVEHAERNAIYQAARNGVVLGGSIAVVNWLPCMPCARAVALAGATHVLCLEPDWNDANWAADFAKVVDGLDKMNVGLWFIGRRGNPNDFQLTNQPYQLSRK